MCLNFSRYGHRGLGPGSVKSSLDWIGLDNSVQERLKAFDSGRVLTASVDESGMLTGKIQASFKKDRTYNVTVGYY